MTKLLVPLVMAMAMATASVTAFAKLPALGDEAKAKAAELAAKSAWSAKVDNYLLCKSQDRVTTVYLQTSKLAGKDARPATPTPPCADAGVFSYTPPEAVKPIEASGAHSPPGTAARPPSTTQRDAVSNPAKKS